MIARINKNLSNFKIHFCLFLATACVVSAMTDNIKGEIDIKRGGIYSIHTNETTVNKTKETDEVLQESPSERIRFKKPIILKAVEKISNKKEETKILGEINTDVKGDKDLTKEEGRYSPVLIFTEAPDPPSAGYWKIIEDPPPYRRKNEYRNRIPIIELQSFNHKPKTSSMEINYPPSQNIEGRNTDDPRYRDYNENLNDRMPPYPERENPSAREHAVHTETNDDYGKFLPKHYKSKIEKEAEEMVKAQKARNTTSNERPSPKNKENRQHNPKHQNYRGNRQNDPEHQDYRGHRQPGNKVFFHLGNIQNPNTFTQVLHHPNRERHQYTFEEYPRTERYTPRPYTYAPKNTQPPNRIRDPYTPRRPVMSKEIYEPEISHLDKHYSSSHSPPSAPKQYDISVEQYPPTYSTSQQGRPPQHTRTFVHSSREYSTSTEQFTPQHYSTSTERFPPQHCKTRKIHPTSYTSDYIPPADHPPAQFQHDERKVLNSNGEEGHYDQPTDHTYPCTSESLKPCAKNPTEPTLPPSEEVSYPKHHDSQPDQPYTKSVEGPQEKEYYNTYDSLLDLYRSYGFNPLDLRMSDMFDSRFHFGSPFRAKIPISGPISGSFSTEDHVSNFKAPEYVEHINSNPEHHDYESYPAFSEGVGYSNEQNRQRNHNFVPDLMQPPVSYLNKDSYYQEQIPYDSNRSPTVSTEYHDSEISRPGLFNTQVESPKETFSQEQQFSSKLRFPLQSTDGNPLDRVKITPIQIKDYNSEDIFGNPSNKGKERYSESEIPPKTPHSIVRENPYQLSSISEEAQKTRYNERPRVYKDQKLEFNSEEWNNKYRTNLVDTSSGTTLADSSTIDEVQNYNPEKIKNFAQSVPKSQQSKSTKHEDSVITSGGQRQRGNIRESSGKKSEKKSLQNDSTNDKQDQRSSRTENSKTRSKKHKKRSSHRKPKKHKPNRRSTSDDHLQAEGTTYHWGMERHKETDGFFQYANVPGAKAFEYGYRMGGPEHTEERHHHTKGIQSKIKVNWKAENGDTGDHYWEFNHNSEEDNSENPKVNKNQSQEL